jgi:hypothetical protein
MDPTRYWILKRRKLSDPKVSLFASSNITVGGGGSSSASYYESWEERAFAEDSGHLGGCIWPPRSYPCTFCGREFRSAQALGGHMNVHRRDRARLKLVGAADDGGSDNQIVSPRQSYMTQPSPPQIASLQHAYVANPNDPSPDTNRDSLCSVLDDHTPRSFAQAAAARNVWGNRVLNAPIASFPAWIDSGKKQVSRDAAQSSPNQARPAARMYSNPEVPDGSGGHKLNILGGGTRKDFKDGSEDEDNVHVGCKRRRIGQEASPLILCSFSRKHWQDDEENNGEERPCDAKVLNLCPTSPVEELDLELRLGVAP